MGRLFFLEYYLTPDVQCFLCLFCRAHIAFRSNYVFLDETNRHGIFREVVNVAIDGPERYRMEGTNRVANCHCVRCNSLVGFKFIEVQNNNNVNIHVRQGRFALNMYRLLWWNGIELARLVD